MLAVMLSVDRNTNIRIVDAFFVSPEPGERNEISEDISQDAVEASLAVSCPYGGHNL